MDMPFYLPSNDVIFKWVFGDPQETDALADFLQAVLKLPEGEFAELSILNPDLPRERPDEKQGILDVMARTSAGKLVNVELQLCNHPHLRDRAVFYLSKAVTGQIGEGDGYDKIRQTVCVLLTNFTLIPESPRYHGVFTLNDLETGVRFSEAMRLDTLEFPKVPPAGQEPLPEWMRFIFARSKENFMAISTTTQNPRIQRAAAKVMALNADEQVRIAAESREKLQRDIASIRSAAEGDGEQRGFYRGHAEAMRDLARKLLIRGRPVEEIMEDTGLSREQIRSLMH